MDDFDKTVMGHGDAGSDVTMPGKRDRKPDGRFEAGDLIMGRYKVLAELGQGGMGVVYKCFDEIAGIEVALKALPPELSHNTLEMEDIKENFQLVHNLHHPNIASSNTLEKDNSNGNYYLIMECVDGEDLRRWIKQKRKEEPLTLEMVLPIIRQVAAALDYAHEEKIIHRDIKPGNIMIDQAGHVKVLDFGLAAQIHTSMTRVSMAYHGTSGTGPYMAPEQWRGRAQGAPSDQYALAVMTYEMLAGHLPFESTDAAVLKQAVLDEEPDAIPNVPSRVQKAVKRAMSKEPQDRFNCCQDFVSVLEGKKIAAPPRRAGYRKHTYWWFAAAAILAMGIIGEVFMLNRHKATEFVFNGTITLPGNVSLKLIKIEAGSFVMGSPSDESDRGNDEAQHRVTLTQDYYLGETEVTQGQYKAVMGNNPSKFKKGDNYPVEQVSWHDAMAFCEKLNQLTEGKRPAGYKFSLPTEAQWAYACRAGTKTAFCYGNSLDSTQANFDGDYPYGNGAKNISREKTVAVRSFEPNAWGLYDMHGNVLEWCLDHCDRDSSNGIMDIRVITDTYTGAQTDPLCNNGSCRVIRGGGWCNDGRGCRSARRGDTYPDSCWGTLGFRVALVPVR